MGKGIQKHRSRSSIWGTVVIVIAGIAMIAHGLRMMTQGIFFPDSFYPAPVPSSIDFWFDWFILFVLGLSIMFIGAKRWRIWMHQKKSKNTDDQTSLSMPT